MDVLESTVLQNNHELIINNVSVKESQILTYLLQSGSLTDNEYEDIKGTEYFLFQIYTTSANSIEYTILKSFVHEFFQTDLIWDSVRKTDIEPNCDYQCLRIIVYRMDFNKTTWSFL